MKVIYPPLVEQSYQLFKAQGTELSKDKVYKVLIANGMINERGEPTKKAVSEGLVAVFNREHLSLTEFRKEYPVFDKYSDDMFIQFDGIWYVSSEIIPSLSERINSLSLTPDEVNQVSSYYQMRNYENPQTIGEFKGVYFPVFSDIDDSHFHYVDDQLCLDVAAVIISCNKVINGEIEGDVESAEQLLLKISEL